MQKEKTITIKTFLNQKYPLTRDIDDKGHKITPVIYYPLYIQITYDRKNTQFRSKLQEYLLNINELNDEQNEILESEMSYLRRIVEYESQKYKDRFTLKGINERFWTYTKSVYANYRRIAKIKFDEIIKKTNSKFIRVFTDIEQMHAPFYEIFEAANILIPDLQNYCDKTENQFLMAYSLFSKYYSEKADYYDIQDFHDNPPYMIDYLEGKLLIEFRKKIEDEGIYTEEMIDGCISSVSSIIEKVISV